MAKTIFSFGEILWDILPSDTILGGAPFNFAYRAHSLGSKSCFISRLGKDDLGKRAFDLVASLGLDTAYLQWDADHPTGTVEVFFNENNNPDYFIVPQVAYDYVEVTDALKEGVKNADCMCFGVLTQRCEISRRTVWELLDSTTADMKFLDINLRKNCFSEETITASLEKANVLKLNEEEVHQLSRMVGISFESIPQFGQEVIQRYCLRYCLVTLGDRGAFAVSRSGEKVYDPGYKVDPVDSLGSGDAFSAGFVHSILNGMSLRQACEFGNMLGAIVATQKGATQPIAPQDIEAFKKKEKPRLYHDTLKSLRYTTALRRNGNVEQQDLHGNLG